MYYVYHRLSGVIWRDQFVVIVGLSTRDFENVIYYCIERNHISVWFFLRTSIFYSWVHPLIGMKLKPFKLRFLRSYLIYLVDGNRGFFHNEFWNNYLVLRIFRCCLKFYLNRDSELTLHSHTTPWEHSVENLERSAVAPSALVPMFQLWGATFSKIWGRISGCLEMLLCVEWRFWTLSSAGCAHGQSCQFPHLVDSASCYLRSSVTACCHWLSAFLARN